jgi:hypothetical protein
MKTFVLASLIAVSATGCVISDDSATAHIGATWTIRTLANPDIGCYPGFNTATVNNQAVDSNGNAVGPLIQDLFDCADGGGTSSALPANTYMTWIAIQDDSMTHTYAQSTPAFLDVTDVDLSYSAEIFDDAGYFQLQWDLIEANSQAPVTCADAGASNVEILVNLSGTMSMDMDQYPCDDGFAVSKPFAAGTYTVSVDAFNASGQVSDSVVKGDQTINDHNKITDLGTAIIPITDL